MKSAKELEELDWGGEVVYDDSPVANPFRGMETQTKQAKTFKEIFGIVVSVFIKKYCVCNAHTFLSTSWAHSPHSTHTPKRASYNKMPVIILPCDQFSHVINNAHSWSKSLYEVEVLFVQ